MNPRQPGGITYGLLLFSGISMSILDVVWAARPNTTAAEVKHGSCFALILRLLLRGTHLFFLASQHGFRILPWQSVPWSQCWALWRIHLGAVRCSLCFTRYPGWFLHLYGSVTIAVSAWIFGWLVMPQVRAFDPEQHDLEQRSLATVVNHKCPSCGSQGKKKLERMNLWNKASHPVGVKNNLTMFVVYLSYFILILFVF